jgi:mono/diheme cytochrome c family protein
MRKNLSLLLVCFMTSLWAVKPSAAADVNNGKRLAERWCVSCHVIGKGQQAATTQAPPFSEVANRPGFDNARLAFFLLDPHPKMPDLGLSRAAAEDLAAYIATQR